MGEDKAPVKFAGRPLLERALAILRQAGQEARIAGARTSLARHSIEGRNQAAAGGPSRCATYPA
jgi:molybdopterin-guanine dinucleotide biosynthesis protein A